MLLLSGLTGAAFETTNPSDVSSDSIDRLKQQLVEAQQSFRQLLAKEGSTNPKLLQIGQYLHKFRTGFVSEDLVLTRHVVASLVAAQKQAASTRAPHANDEPANPQLSVNLAPYENLIELYELVEEAKLANDKDISQLVPEFRDAEVARRDATLKMMESGTFGS
ncbi:MAG: hypothetical protein ACTHLN_03895, partial [Tepidisphaeraceae bacterium]